MSFVVTFLYYCPSVLDILYNCRLCSILRIIKNAAFVFKNILANVGQFQETHRVAVMTKTWRLTSKEPFVTIQSRLHHERSSYWWLQMGMPIIITGQLHVELWLAYAVPFSWYSLRREYENIISMNFHFDTNWLIDWLIIYSLKHASKQIVDCWHFKPYRWRHD